MEMTKTNIEIEEKFYCNACGGHLFGLCNRCNEPFDKYEEIVCSLDEEHMVRRHFCKHCAIRIEKGG